MMTKEKAMKDLKERYAQVYAALEALPENVNVIDAHVRLSRNMEDYIHLDKKPALQNGPVITQVYENGTLEYSVQVQGVKVLWLHIKELEP